MFWIDETEFWAPRLDAIGMPWRGGREPLAADAMRAAAATWDPAGLLLDDYRFRDAHAEALRGYRPCARFDDFGSARAGDLIVVPGLDAPDPTAGPGRRILAGAPYAALDRSFAARRRQATARDHPPTARRILVAFGGRDSRDLTMHALTAMALLDRDVEATVLMGVSAPHLEGVRAACARHGWRLVVDAAAEEIAELCLAHDLAIGAGGVGFLERLCCGLPSVLVLAAENQRSNVEAAVARGLARVADMRSAEPRAAIAEALRALIDDRPARQAIATAGMQLVDGRGGERIAAALESL